MPRSWDRGQTEPLAAIVAVVAVCLALSFYAGVLDATLPGSPDRELAESASERVENAVAPDGVAKPSLVDAGQEAGPDGYRTNVTLTVDDEGHWAAGPTAPHGADTATVRLGVKTSPATVQTGTLRVVVWS